jgi:hypothetical protein
MGIYRFVVQGWALRDALKEIERHRGLRPKGSVTVLYNSILPWLAPERSAQDPTVALLRACAAANPAVRAQVADRSGQKRTVGSSGRSAEASSRR